MSENFGPGVTTTLSAIARQFMAVVWQDGKPPMDSELNLMAQVEWETLAQSIRVQTHSGFFADPTRCQEDYEFNPLWSNQFFLGPRGRFLGVDEDAPVVVACVNGWVIPVVGTGVTTDGISNRIRLNPPPTTDRRTDFVFLEVWRTLVSPNPSTANKPDASHLWKYGNVEYGGTNLPDDLENPDVPYETTKRVQLQYRIRVVGSGDALGTSIDLATYPDGMTDPQVRAQGTATSPGSFTFSNMRDELGDPSLWRAGDGDPTNALGTIDGYVYAVPIAGVFRRNYAGFTALTFSGNPNQNGATTRTPSSSSLPNPRDGARPLLQAALGGSLAPGVTGSIVLTNLAGSGLDDPALFPAPGALRFLVVGEGINEEIIAISAVNVGAGTVFIDPNGRGRGGSASRTPVDTAGRWHASATKVRLYNSNPNGAYSDEIEERDVVDLRRSITLGDWDYDRLLQHAVASLVQGSLRTTYKKSGTGGNTFGTTTTEVSYLHSPLASPLTPPNHVGLVDGPDGIRTIWSDSAALQKDVSVILDPAAPMVNGNIASMDTNASLLWSVSADFQPHGFLNCLGVGTGWTNGSTIFFHIGGVDGASGARYGLIGGQKSVRFLAPYEAWLPDNDRSLGDQHPWKLRFLGGPSGNTSTPSSANANGYIAGRMTNNPGSGESAATYPGPMYPVKETNFERPFIVLGDLLHPTFQFTGVPANSTNFIDASGTYQINIPGQNWNTFLSTTPLGPHGRTLRDYLTNDGRDYSGDSSQLYIVVYGDTDSRDNNGAFKVVGAGTINAQSDNPFTLKVANSVSGLIVVPLSADFDTFFNSTRSVTIEIRSQEITAEADSGKTNPAGVAVVLTDLAGFNGFPSVPGNQPLPWSYTTPPMWDDGTHLLPLASKAVMTMDTMWYPNRGSSARVPNTIHRFACLSSEATLSRSVVSAIDPNFVSEAGFPSGERHYDVTQVQLWNRLPSKGLYPVGEVSNPVPGQWGGNIVGSSEQDRETELFVDLGSKTVIFQPFTLRNMALKGVTITGADALWGDAVYTSGPPVGAPIDGAGIFTTGRQMGYQIPFEYLPRFGRQDIPYHISTGSGDPVLPGINHLFADQLPASNSASVFWVVGGENNSTSGSLVSPMLFATEGSSIPYCLRGTLGGALHPSYGARRVFLSNVVSGDLGPGMNGIELPPYHGLARLYGVYELADFMANLSPTYPGGFQSDRVTPIVSPPRNLLKVGADKQTLFIRQGGGEDVTGSDQSHTYIVPESALDITNIPGYVAGQTFDDFDYVVEGVVFGFAKGFISENNFVIARRKTGGGTAVVDGSNPELTQVAMTLPSAASKGSGLYQLNDRTVYQGDPYMTRDGATLQLADYGGRYGQIPQASAFQLATPIQQFNATTGAMIVTRPNPRAFQVLATMDFYTTLGTGKVGGQMWPGTPLDCGYTDPAASSRIPTTSLSLPWMVFPRTFTAGQTDSFSYASLELAIRNYASAITYHLTVTIEAPGANPVTFTAPGSFTGGSNAAMAQDLAEEINLLPSVSATASNGVILIQSRAPGSIGNQIKVTTGLRPGIAPAAPGPYLGPLSEIVQVFKEGELDIPSRARGPIGGAVTGSYLLGGVDVPVNAGNGDSMISLTGMTERLPLGILVNDSDFLSENLLGDGATSLRSFSGGVRAVYQDLPLTSQGQEYTRFVNDPGSLLAASDGSILRYTPYTVSTPSGTTSFRIYRGGGAVFVLSGNAPGGPVSWVSDSFASALRPVLKGAALACKAILVRNHPEQAFGVANVRSQGDEVQLVILTHAFYGTPTTTQDGANLTGVISPTGYGEGYAAADRYLIHGRPMYVGRARRIPNPAMDPAPYVTND